MRNLFLLLSRLRLFFLFCLLQGIAVTLTIRQFNYQKVLFFQVTSGLTDPIFSGVQGIRDYLRLKEEVSFLREENARLYSKLQDTHLKVFGSGTVSSDTQYVQAYGFLPARIIQNNLSSEQNFFTIDIGSLHGVETEMGVISPQGAMGFVVSVSPHYALCMSVLNTKSAISVQMTRGKHMGTLAWDGSNPRYGTVKFVPSHAEVKLGDTVETSGYSTLFPEGILIGEVTRAQTDPYDGYYELQISFFVDFFSQRSVYVVRNRFAKEWEALQKATGDL
jgi:rod shape-determining protein MreC